MFSPAPCSQLPKIFNCISSNCSKVYSRFSASTSSFLERRGGSPSAYDRVLATQFGSYAAKLVEIEQYGVTVALVNNHVISNRLEDIAGKTRNIPEGCELLTVAKRMGISLG